MEQDIIRFEQLKLDNTETMALKIAARLSAGIALKHCYRVGWSLWYSVRIGLGRKQWEVGRHHDRTTAVRLADCVTVYFWKYRTTRLLPPSDSDVNLSVEQATRDMTDHPEIVTILDRWASALTAKGFLNPPLPEIVQAFDYNKHRVSMLRHAQGFLSSADTLRKHCKPEHAVHVDALVSALGTVKEALRNVDRILLEN